MADGKIDLHVGKRLQQRRRLLRLSQTDVAKKVELTPGQINKYEKGVTQIVPARLHSLANALEIPVSYFFDGLQEPNETQIPGYIFDLASTKEGHSFATTIVSLTNPKLRKRVLIICGAIIAAMLNWED